MKNNKNNFICMKDIKHYLTEGFKLGKDYKNPFNYHPKTRDELKKLIKQLISERGNDADLNDIDVSKIDSMKFLFTGLKFDGDISRWDVSHVENMSDMFSGSEFNGDISEWDVSNVQNMSNMFYQSDFDGDLSKWDVSNVYDMYGMFNESKFTGQNGDISKWDVINVKDMRYMFCESSFSGDVSKWKIRLVKTDAMFKKCPVEDNAPKWYRK